ncbi:hypothetical protein [Echinimonas agarilytica]|uniref:DUF4198 domain-containing protein n=1 Tax=Echinimonas agarilytica TaxID=1215918 RepID=A0AA41W456_9GAMM|nr:hypothetical protein [Echinimonas agarilytica]MCM2678526.1 hypothetical protein [Echinimonas agarilytica]
MSYLNVQTILKLIFLFPMLWLASAIAAPSDVITSLKVDPEIGYEQTPVVRLSVEIETQRDLHVVMQRSGDWKTIKKVTQRVKKSGNYTLKLPVENLQPGEYRVDAYLSPRRKGFKDKIGQVSRVPLKVLDKPTIEKEKFAAEDKVLNVTFPKQVTSNGVVDLDIKFQVVQARVLQIRLLDSDSWEEFGELTYPVPHNGNISIPLENMSEQFPTGNYAWVISLLDNEQDKQVMAKLGKHFTLSANQ